MKESSKQIAARIMAPASTSALWTYDQAKALVVKVVEQERAASEVRDKDGLR